MNSLHLQFVIKYVMGSPLHICNRPIMFHSYLCNQNIVTYVLQTLYNIIRNVSTQT